MSKSVYVILSESSSVISRAIKFATSYPYNHVSLSFEDSFPEMYSFGRRNLRIPMIGAGFVIERPKEGFFSQFPDCTCRVLEFCVTDDQYQSLKHAVRRFRLGRRHFKYDLLGITLLRPFGFTYTRPRKYICSHFVGEMLSRAGVCSFSKPTCLLRPEDFENLPDKRVLYTGLFNESSGHLAARVS